MKKNLLLLLLLVLLAGGGYWLASQQNDGGSTYDEGDLFTRFAIKDRTAVERVFLANKEGERLLLERKADYWMMTNQTTGKQYKANPNAIHYLMETLVRLRVRNRVNKDAMPNVVRTMASSAVKVEVYLSDKQLYRSFYVGSMTDGGMANYIKMDGDDAVYVGYIPNFQGTIDSRFSLIEDDWRDKAFVRVKPGELEFMEVAYQEQGQRGHSFRIEVNGKDDYTVKPLDETVAVLPTQNKANIKAFVNDFDVMSAERIITEKRLRDSILTTSPFMVLSYKSKSQTQPQRLVVYALNNDSADRGDGNPGVRERLQRYFVYLDQEHFFMVQHIVLRRILWGYSFFFQQESVKLKEDESVFTGSMKRN